ncbi:alpha-fetoprotein-like [Python bivittatus]|uniref:Alpha-fetoprotein-like n=1 Tax=Python bivittatus TaxID=176946 RepID=A0A9F5IVF7_PYTBI|nr:alpha-fetoprotein-like [Python bivittatus]
MKWVIFISVLCLVSFAELKNLPRRYWHVDDHIKTIKVATIISSEEFAGALIALYAQNVQQATLEEVLKLAKMIIALHQKCAADKHSDPECTKPLGTIFLDTLCRDVEFSVKYDFHDCCSTADPERNECILSHKKMSEGFIPPFVHLTIPEVCKAHHNNRHDVLTQYLYEVARRYPKALIALLSHTIKTYDKVFPTCCEADNNDACFWEKATEVTRKFKEKIHEQEDICFILNNYGKDTLYPLKFVETIDKFSHADQATVAHIAKNILHIHEATCKGDTLESLLDRDQSFLFNLTRSHPELSKLLDMEIFLRYKDLLGQCCKLEDHAQCLHTGEEQLELLIAKIEEVVKKNCEQYKKIGGYFFQNELLVKYTKIMPQLPSLKLILFTKELAHAAEKCCSLDSHHQLSCALEDMDKVIGSICQYHKEHHINKQVCQCCDYFSIRRWECITNLGADPDYVPPATFKSHVMDDPDGLCSTDEHIVQKNKQGLLIDLIEFLPHITDNQLANATIGFHLLQAECCADEHKRECFDSKGEPLIKRIQDSLKDV